MRGQGQGVRGWMVAGVALLAGLHAASFLGAGPIDDDFILYRYAENAWNGAGLSFEEGQRSEGFSTPFYLAWLIAGLALGLDPEWLSVATGVAACALCAASLAWCWRVDVASSEAPWPALLLACAPTFAWHGVAGLGTTLLAACLSLWFLSFLQGHTWRAALWLALACGLRQESVLFLPGFALVMGRDQGWKRGTIAALAVPLLVLLGWTLFRRMYFGSWLPITYWVKKLPWQEDLLYGARYLWSSTTECGVLLLLLFLPGLPRRSPWTGLASGLLLYSAYVVYVGGDWVPWARFFMPVLPLLFLAACRVAHRLPGAACAFFLTALALLPQYLQTDWTRNGRPQRHGSHAFFEQRWALLGETLGGQVDPRTRVGLSPIGAFGWHSGLPLVDLLGLTHPHFAALEPDLSTTEKGHHRSDADWALSQRPEIFLLGNGVLQPGGELAINPWERELYQHPRFQAEYEPVYVPMPRGGPMPCYVRRGWKRPDEWRNPGSGR